MTAIRDFLNLQILTPYKTSPLPLVHVTTLARFRSIMTEGCLTPQPCSILKKEVLYCSYGEVIVRPSGKQRGWNDDAPVVLLLTPAVLQGISGFSPIDTGAIASGRLRRFPDSKRSRLDELFVVRDPKAKMLNSWVDIMYGGNAGYLNRAFLCYQNGEPDEVSLVRELCSIVSTGNLETDHELDFRAISQIECHIEQRIPLRQCLRKAYFPDTARAQAKETMERLGCSVQFYSDGPSFGNLPLDLLSMVKSSIYRSLA